MRVWRISDFADLRGDGGLRASGRWHTRGRPIVYLADHPASALLEVLVHLEVDVEDLPATYQLLATDVPDEMARRATATEEHLSPDWIENLTVTRRLGDEWLKSAASALLRVPSAIVPSATNWLLNPRHPDAASIRVVDLVRVPFDPRLVQR
jgi:RES domain-containing protein